MSKEESSLIHALTQHPGWALLQKKLVEMKRNLYERLRHYKRDREFYQCQGKLDIIDWLFSEVDRTIYDVFDEEEK